MTASTTTTIRPWSLALSVREITSVSATFVLTSSLTPSNGEQEPSLASLGLSPDDSDIDEDGEYKKDAVIVDALAKDLSVTVSGSPWQRVLIRVDEQTDEAVIVIYGLMPGRQYDIDLGLVRAGHNNTVRRQVVTEDHEHSTPETTRDSEASNGDPPADLHPSLYSSASTSPNRSSSNSVTPPSTPQHSAQNAIVSPLTLDERLQQLQRSLSLFSSERDTLTASLKASRRDSQKADAALRSEIDILKRASEKHTAAEFRAKQKVLALQEAVKRAQTGTKEVDEMVDRVEADLPALKQQRDDKERDYHALKDQVGRLEREREKEAEKERKRQDSLRAELTGLSNKLDKLNGKRDKLEGTVVVDLEDQLREIERQIRIVGIDPFGYASSAIAESGADDEAVSPVDLGLDVPLPHDIAARYGPALAYVPTQKGRTASASAVNQLYALYRPSSLAPIQRPMVHPNRRSPPHDLHPTQARAQQQQHAHRPSLSASSTKLPTQTATLSPGPPPQPSTAALSSHAPPFEPSRVGGPPVQSQTTPPLLRSSFPPSGGPGPVPIHRPRFASSDGRSKWDPPQG